MKRNLVLLTLVAVLVVMASFASAGAGAAMRIHVPFNFYIQDQLLPAGDYRFEMGSGPSAVPSLVTVQDPDGTGMIMLTTPGGLDSDSDLSVLRFNQYGDKYFLSHVSIRGHKANVKMFNLEKELRSQYQNARATTLFARN